MISAVATTTEGKSIQVGLLHENIKESVKRKLLRIRKALLEAIGEDFNPKDETKKELFDEEIKVDIDPVNADYLYDFTSKSSDIMSYNYELLDLLCE
jgi:hypothetical protein